MKRQKEWKGINIFCSYAQADQTVQKRLGIHMSQLKRNGLIEEWSEQQVLAGADRVQEIDHAIRSAHIILLLIRQCRLSGVRCLLLLEMQHALERHKLERRSSIDRDGFAIGNTPHLLICNGCRVTQSPFPPRTRMSLLLKSSRNSVRSSHSNRCITISQRGRGMRVNKVVMIRFSMQQFLNKAMALLG